MSEDTHVHHHLSATDLLQIIQAKISPFNATHTEDRLIGLATLIFRRPLSLSSDQVLLWRGMLGGRHHRPNTSTDAVQTHDVVRKQKRRESN